VSRRQQIVNLFIKRLEDINKSNGYENDIKKVDEWSMSKLEKQDMPAIVLRDTGSSVDSSTSGSSKNKLEIEIDVMVSDKDTTMATLRTVMSDVLTAVGNETDDLPEYRFYNGDEILAEHQNHIYGGSRMKFTVIYDSFNWEI